jgi:hypothetical protein
MTRRVLHEACSLETSLALRCSKKVTLTYRPVGMASSGKVGEEHWGAETGYRARRLAWFVALADEVLKTKRECRILDLGGNSSYWRDLEPVWRGRNLKFTLVNMAPEAGLSDPYTAINADARSMAQFADQSFDIVHSNSVLEHVGRWKEMRAFAAEIRRLAPRYFVQTPYFWFPLEPHFRVPFFNWLPEPVRLSLVMWRGCGAFPRAENIDDAVRFIEDSNLVDVKRFRALFPDAEIKRERVYGLTKSLIAIR